MKKREPVSHIMTKNVFTIKEEDQLRDAVALIKNNNIRHLPVVKGEAITGIISSTDINRLTFSGLFNNQEGADEAILDMLSIPQVMTHNPVSVNSDALIKQVAELFVGNGFHAMPVINDGELEGIVTTTDVIKYLLDQY